VTPSKHIAKSEAAARAIATPGQPRKTPKGKFTTAAIAEESEEDDEISALPMMNIKPVMSSKLPRTTLKRKAPASEHKGTAARNALESGQFDRFPRSPYKVAKLGAGATASARRPLEPSSPTPNRKRPVSPTPSRLPQPTTKRPPVDNGWIAAKAPEVVMPNAKSGRPLLRSTRRRRSSLSAVE
jgi:cell division cycle 14